MNPMVCPAPWRLFFAPRPKATGLFDIVRERKFASVSLSVCLSSVRCPFREAASTNSEPFELGMVLNEGKDRKTLLRRGRPRRRCTVLEI